LGIDFKKLIEVLPVVASVLELQGHGTGISNAVSEVIKLTEAEIARRQQSGLTREQVLEDAAQQWPEDVKLALEMLAEGHEEQPPAPAPPPPPPDVDESQ
jgi:hypothetical protein